MMTLDLRGIMESIKGLNQQSSSRDEPPNNPRLIRESLCSGIIPVKIVIRVEGIVWERMKNKRVIPDGFVTPGEGVYEGQLEESISFDCSGKVEELDYALSLFMKGAREDQESIYVEYIHDRPIPALVDLMPPDSFHIRRLSHHLQKTAARSTDAYIFSQLIPYIGNKRKLLDIIHEAIQLTGLYSGTFVDLFSGSTVVARFAKQLGYRVLANDWEPYSEQIAIGTVTLNEIPAFAELGGHLKVFEMLNSLQPIEGYISLHLCPKDDDNPNHESERQFFMRKNGMKIDAMREKIAEWQDEEKLSSGEFGYLMAAFVYSVSYVSNTSGVFKGFHRGWGGSRGAALHRICSDFELVPPVVHDNKKENITTREDAGVLVSNLTKILGERPEIVYLDMPYNQHPYGSNYHVLNTIVLWDKPELPRNITRGTKAAIRKDWRTERRSAYNYRNRATAEFKKLVDSIDAKFILTSYSTEGNIPLEDLMAILGGKGSIRVVKREYIRYRVSPTRPSPKPRNIEFVVITDTSGEAETEERLSEHVADLLRRDADIPESDDVLPMGQRTIQQYAGGGQRSLQEYSADSPEEGTKAKLDSVETNGRRAYRCGNCGEEGHNARTCQN